ENSDASGERLKAAISGSLTANAANICDRTSYDAGTEHIFLLNNATGGLNTYCDVNSTVNTCSASDKTTMTYNYTECATLQAYSAGGVVKSMWSSSDANYEYVHVYNTDDTTDEGTTYRFTCYVIPINTSQEVNQVNATQYPQQCATSQTPTSVDSPGAIIVFYRNETC
ncbi:hypothetical protein MAR_023806, partial [Mya arenaria]